MRIAIRTDASVEIGTGHVMRCLVLADELKRRGGRVRFVCAPLPGALEALIVAHGHSLDRLPSAIPFVGPSHWSSDAYDTAAILSDWQGLDWLIVDHYGLDASWESSLREIVGHIMVIDDLANRRHECDVLLDQNDVNADVNRYRPLVPSSAALQLGPTFALVREEFYKCRVPALDRRSGELRRLLMCMGGSDPRNETTKALKGLEQISSIDLTVDVVIGAANRHRDEVEDACANLPQATLHVETSRMAELMTAADCALGAGGTTTWERCTLGLPAVTTVVADNQREGAARVAALGAQRLLGWYSDLTPDDYARAITTLGRVELASMSRRAADLCDGRGAQRVTSALLSQRRPRRAAHA